VSAPFPFGITIEVERQPAANDFGDRSYSPSHSIDGCATAPRYSTEVNDGRSAVITGLHLYGPYGADLRATDRVVLPGTEPRKQRTWRVVGDVGSYRSPWNNWMPGFEAALERVTG
jgi:hypothetical protein